MYARNSKGPSILPWGTPDVTLNQSDAWPSITTRCFLDAHPFTIRWIVIYSMDSAIQCLNNQGQDNRAREYTYGPGFENTANCYNSVVILKILFCPLCYYDHTVPDKFMHLGILFTQYHAWSMVLSHLKNLNTKLQVKLLADMVENFGAVLTPNIYFFPHKGVDW